MKFGLTENLSSEIAREKANIMTAVSMELESFFKKENYGDGVKEILLALKCVAPRYEHFHIIYSPGSRK